ncbi:hypothetical protein [Escherichia phage FEC19]|uniref:Uncharacterized protein n=1 Tax=Escherichia phage FEC19 TaxID=2315486 RepID=A0A386KJF5_9CAUD|nr:hypothetical protein HOU28_gp07 [Escherichia phage FEC19]AYD85436.1 hypothetical protein [Escherichia phage FEC19]
MKTLHLQARSLASKFGFMDGDIVSLFCEENNIESELKDKDSHDVLIKLVRKHLLPLVSHVKVFEILTMHNPIRCEDDFIDEMRHSDVQVEVGLEEVLQCIKETEKFE